MSDMSRCMFLFFSSNSWKPKSLLPTLSEADALFHHLHLNLNPITHQSLKDSNESQPLSLPKSGIRNSKKSLSPLLSGLILSNWVPVPTSESWINKQPVSQSVSPVGIFGPTTTQGSFLWYNSKPNNFFACGWTAWRRTTRETMAFLGRHLGRDERSLDAHPRHHRTPPSPNPRNLLLAPHITQRVTKIVNHKQKGTGPWGKGTGVIRTLQEWIKFWLKMEEL